MNIKDSVDGLKGIGPKTAVLFDKLKVHTIEDLLRFYPRNYLSYNEPVSVMEAKAFERVAIKATIQSYVEVKRVKSLTIVSCNVQDKTGKVRLTWFNSPFLKKVFHIGQTYVFVGTISYKNYQLTMEHPEYYNISEYEKLVSSLQPVYPLTEGLSNKTVTKAIHNALPFLDEIRDFLPEAVIKKYHLMPLRDAIRGMHFPDKSESLMECRKRLVFDEFFLFLARMHVLRENTVRLSNKYIIEDFSCIDDFINKLPFSLTKGQLQTLEDIQEDMKGSTIMNRLVQGDVGSGKTVVAQMAALSVVKNGYQVAFMAPTEVLAMQHYEGISKDLKPYGIRTALLVGSTKISEKRKIYEALKEGEIDIIIGTHALIQDKVVYKNLALVITDEQHRFGVRQRMKLSEKGEAPHVLVMSATPIPRTLAIILYGDLDISVMKDMPSMRKPIKNCVVGPKYRPTAYKFMSEQIKMGHQIYIICPMVESSDNLDVENVMEYRDSLMDIFPKEVQISFLHGKMSSEEKNNIMESFSRNEIQILVSTTVIEVGINNPNATVMMIENAERFGLSQLHQLRGRVGRGDAQSYCIFLCGNENKDALKRLEILNKSNDGFFIANEDLKLRGPGDLFGVRQSGDMLFSLGDIYQDADMLKLANEAVMELQREGISLGDILGNQETFIL